MNSIIVNSISKSFEATAALNDISFEVDKGELFGLIGPDGAGKTTLMRVLCTVMLADKGIATINGWDVVKDYKKIRSGVGYMPGRFSLYQDLSVEENLKFFATIFRTTIKENYNLIKDIYVQLEPFNNRKAGKLSGGMKQKLALCCALIHKPKVLFLDEPTTGVDAIARKDFWEMLRRLKEKGITILVSTPYMDEASKCDRVGLMQSGKILKINSTENIVAQFDKEILGIKAKNTHKLLKDLEKFEFMNSVYPFGEYLHYTDKREDFSVEDILIYLEEKEHKNVHSKSLQPNIEDCFMALMDKEH